jgi:hypothetical protein
MSWDPGGGGDRCFTIIAALTVIDPKGTNPEGKKERKKYKANEVCVRN